MKKLLLTVLSVLMFASAVYSADGVAGGIKKYKEGNYTGCIEWMESVIKNDPANAVAYYYLAMSYVQAGRKDEAIDNYSKVIMLNTNSLLTEYAERGKLCLEDPEKCHITDEKSAFIESPFGTGLSKSVEDKLEKRELEIMRKEINSNKEIPEHKLQEYRDFSSQNNTNDMPSNDEIVAAMRILQRAGLQGYSMPTQANMQMNDISAFLGQNNLGAGNNLMNMLPYLNNGNMRNNPQLIQTMLMNQMMPDFSSTNDRR
ncbi:tetratricopeptide repeat protein [bacterium]|nr:tetratricopeptide repeat protein [bacterium]